MPRLNSRTIAPGYPAEIGKASAHMKRRQRSPRAAMDTYPRLVSSRPAAPASGKDPPAVEDYARSPVIVHSRAIMEGAVTSERRVPLCLSRSLFPGRI
jgi:hypothetical protein